MSCKEEGFCERWCFGVEIDVTPRILKSMESALWIFSSGMELLADKFLLIDVIVGNMKEGSDGVFTPCCIPPWSVFGNTCAHFWEPKTFEFDVGGGLQLSKVDSDDAFLSRLAELRPMIGWDGEMAFLGDVTWRSCLSTSLLRSNVT